MNFLENLFQWCCNVDSPPVRANMKSTSNKISKVEQKHPHLVSPPLSSTSNNVLNYRESVCWQDQGRAMRKDHYDGEEVSGVPSGNGLMLYANGDFYRGGWVDGKKEGQGLQIYHKLNLQYEGEWKNNMQDGTGKLIQQNSSSYYEGQFKNGEKHGKGTYFNAITKKQYNQIYDNGVLKEQKEIVAAHPSQEEEYATLNLDKERFDSVDLQKFQRTNPHIRQLPLLFLMKYFGLSKIISLEFISKKLRQWSIKQVLDFLQAINLNSCKEQFYKNKIRGADLVNLKDKQLKNDLKMKLGDRKRFLNYQRFLKELEDGHFQNSNGHAREKKKLAYRLRSADSMKNALKNIKSSVYNESIRQESSQSEADSQVFLTTRQQQRGDRSESSERIMTPDKYKSGQAAGQVQLYSENNQENYSLEKLVEPKSERSEQISRTPRRKNSKQAEFVGQAHFMPANRTFHNIPEENMAGNQRFSQKLNSVSPSPQNQNHFSSSQSSQQDQFIKRALQRKKTVQRSHLPLQSSQIRQLYDFLKEHRSLSFIIKEKDIQDIELIGEGGFGKVYKGKYIGQQIAIKDYIKTGKHKHKQDFMKELDIISDLKHPNIVLYMGICITANKYTLITEYLENGSLFDQLHKKKKKFTESEQMSIAYDIVKGMVYLHNMKKILHRDLKSSNVLIGEDWQVKLCDFGLSGQKKKKGQKLNKNKVGTYQWMAPQVMRNQEKIDQYADVYSFGVIIWELLSEKIPYDGLTEQQIAGLVGYDDDYEFEEPTGAEFLKTVMRKCLNRHRNERPSFIQIQNQFDQEYAILQKGTNQ